MKKLIAAIVIASMGAAFAAEVPSVVYDYKASIKRLDLQLKYVKKSKVVAQNFKVVSDTIQGYVTLPLCDNCLPAEERGIETTDKWNEFTGYAYLTLKGNKYAKDKKRYVLKTPVTAKAAVFGSDAWLSNDDEIAIPPVDPKKNTKAWMALNYAMPAKGEIDPDFDVTALLKGAVSGADDLQYLGFLGLAHFGNDPVGVQNTGFGTAKVVTTKTPGASNLCGGYTPGNEYNCTIVNTISGTLVGYPYYKGPCDHLPMWDVCVVSTSAGVTYKMVSDSVISGTWNLKYNAKLSGESKKEAAILSALKADAKVMYEIDEAGNLK